MNDLELFTEKQKEFLSFMRTRYMLYHSSNVFFRDLHYGVMAFLDLNGRKHTYTGSEDLTTKIVDSLIGQGILLNVANQAYLLNYPEFKKPAVKPAAPAKPAPAAAPARPAAPSVLKPAAAAPPRPGVPAAAAPIQKTESAESNSNV